MKKDYKIIALALIASLGLLFVQEGKAGNPDRSGEAGAAQLLINPFGRSSGWGGANSASIRGLEAQMYNVAGLAFNDGTELLFTNTQWLQGSGVTLNAFGIAQKVGDGSSIGISVMSMSFGDVLYTTNENPDGGVGTFSPSLTNIGVSYAKAFSNSIYGGITLRIITESISDINGAGVTLDAGIQYVTGDDEQIKFGIALKNVGPKMKYKGDGLSLKSVLPGRDDQYTVLMRAAGFEMPSLLNIGAAYDFHFGEAHRLTPALNFCSNSFTRDQFTGGLEYSLKEFLMIRGGYTYENGMYDEADRTTVFSGLSAGMTVEIPFNRDSNSTFGLDYSFRDTNPFGGVHSIGARIKL